MDRTSAFERIVLVKGFNDGCLPVLRERLGKYTHLQSVNGILLDRLTIDRVTAIIRGLSQTRVQLLIRYIHPKRPHRESRLEQFPNRQSTRPTFKKRTSIDATAEILPLPLFILGDNFRLRNKLFQLLSQADDISSGSLDTNSLHSPSVKSEGAALPPGIASPSHDHLSVSDGGSLEALDAEEDVATPIEVVQKGLAAAAIKRRLSLSLKELSESDRCIERALVLMKKFEIDPKSLPDLENEPSKDDAANTPRRNPRQFSRMFSTRPEIAEWQYILNMLKKGVERQFAHLFLRSSGLYLIAVGLDDFVHEPLIQYENLCYWLRLIHSHVRPEEIKRVIVVGMYQKTEVQEQEELILECVTHLNTAIREQLKQVYGIPLKEKGYVFMFDLDNPTTETQYLCTCIRSLTEVFVDQVWYFRQEFFETVFRPFEKFKKVCVSLVELAKQKAIVQATEVEKLYAPQQVPDMYLETLSAYSSACIFPEQRGEHFAVSPPRGGLFPLSWPSYLLAWSLECPSVLCC